MTEDMLAVATTDPRVVALEPAPLLLAAELQACAEVFPDLDCAWSASPARVQADPLRLPAGAGQPGRQRPGLRRRAGRPGRPPAPRAARRPGPALVELAVSDGGPGCRPTSCRGSSSPTPAPRAPAAVGSGLGLSVVRELVEAHGGRVSYDAAANAFRVVLPAPADLSLVEPVAADPVA